MLTVTQSRDFSALNRLINHPDIAPHVRDDSSAEEIDISPLNNHENIFLLLRDGETHAGFVFMLHRGYGVYEQHSGLLKPYRGHNALRAGRDVLRWMFINTDCGTVSTWAWSNAKHVLFMARTLGFTEEARTRWPTTVNGQSVDRTTFSVTLSEWARRAKDDYVEDSMRMNFGVEPQMMGFDAMFARMVVAGQYDKAQSFYNRVAAVMGAHYVSVQCVRNACVIAAIAGRLFEIAPDLSVSPLQPNSLCHSSQPPSQH